jgi:hypothetical protein
MHPTSVRREALALLASGTSVNAASKSLGVSRAAIREWRDRPDSLVARAACPAPATASPAYAALFGYYLGDGCISEHARTTALRVACDVKYPGIIEDARTLMVAVHPERPVHVVTAPGMVSLVSLWKHWPCLFPQHGPGRKHERALEMTDWQREIVERYPAEFLRGLFHSDGCRVNNWATRTVAGQKKRYDYPRWQFVNESAEIMRWCGEALDLVGIAWRQTNRRTLSVSRREAVAELDGLIGPKC